MCIEYFSFITFGETALLGMHGDIPAGLEIRQKKEKEYMVCMVNASKSFVYTCF